MKIIADVVVFPNGEGHCVRSDGKSLRAWFRTREEAEAFAADPANHPVYLGDVAHSAPCLRVLAFVKPEWLFPEWKTMTSEDSNVQ